MASLVRNCDRDTVYPLDKIVSFRDEEYQFLRITQLPRTDSQGKILVVGKNGEREYYPSVFDCTIIDW